MRDFEDYGDDYEEEPRRSRLVHPISLFLLAIALFALGFLSFLFSADRLNQDEANATDDVAPTTTAAPSTTTTVEEAESVGSTTTEAATAGSRLPAASGSVDGAYVEATLNLDAGPGPGMFTLSGLVPDAEIAEALVTAAELSYAPFVESDLEIDESLEPAPWLESSPLLVGLLPSVTDGTIRIADGKVDLIARSPNPQYLAQLEGALVALSGLPVEVSDPTITDLEPPQFFVKVDGGSMELTGEVPSDEIRQLLVGGATAAYGAENVTSDLSIDDGTYTSFWMYTMPGVFQLFAPFPQYEFQVVDGQSSGALLGGVNFAVDSPQISEQAAQVLNIGVAIMARDISIFMTVEGHTDASGPDDYNMALSEARAESVVAYFAAAGISPQRLLAIGAGESDPVASNDTVEGKAQNRRVEFLFGPPPSG